MPDPIETVEYDVPDDISDLDEREAGPYRSLLEIWRAVLEPARDGDMRSDPISPQWATKMVSTYPEIRFTDVLAIHHGVFDMAGALGNQLDEEIATDDECLKVPSAEEDALENAEHYRNVLTRWQIYLLTEELAWSPNDEDAAVQLAILSEVQQMFLGQTGLVAHLDSIGFQFTESDQAELAVRLAEARAAFLTRGDDE
jgi:hypothetical protein